MTFFGFLRVFFFKNLLKPSLQLSFSEHLGSFSIHFPGFVAALVSKTT